MNNVIRPGLSLYTYFRSSAAFRVRIALNVKGIDYDPIYVNLAKGEQSLPEFGSVNYQRRVPVLVVTDDTGNKALTQSAAIIEYLEERYPNPALLPGNSNLAERQKVREVMNVIMCDTQPYHNLGPLTMLGDICRQGGSMTEADIEKYKVKWARHHIQFGLDVIDKLITPTAGECAFGDSVSMADVFIAPLVKSALRFDINPQNYPTVAKVYSNISNLKPFIAASPDNQPDNPLLK